MKQYPIQRRKNQREGKDLVSLICQKFKNKKLDFKSDCYKKRVLKLKIFSMPLAVVTMSSGTLAADGNKHNL